MPFFDYRLVEFMFRIKETYKIKNGVSKYLLRKAMKGIVPNVTLSRVKKTGWNAPAHLWFSAKSEYDKLKDLVNSTKFKNYGIYNNKEVNKIIEDHKSIVDNKIISENHMMVLWQLVNLNAWLDIS